MEPLKDPCSSAALRILSTSAIPQTGYPRTPAEARYVIGHCNPQLPMLFLSMEYSVLHQSTPSPEAKFQITQCQSVEKRKEILEPIFFGGYQESDLHHQGLLFSFNAVFLYPVHTLRNQPSDEQVLARGRFCTFLNIPSQHSFSGHISTIGHLFESSTCQTTNCQGEMVMARYSRRVGIVAVNIHHELLIVSGSTFLSL